MSCLRKFPIALLTPDELRVLRRLDTPGRVQDFVDALVPNRESEGATLQSVRETLRSRTAHCIEGALVAAAALWLNGMAPLVLDMQAENDSDHVIALFRERGRWGAISKSAHATLRWRDPLYVSPRELVMSYFHEYLNKKGNKTLVAYSRPFDLSRIDPTCWITGGRHVWDIGAILDDLPHLPIASPGALRNIRPHDAFTKRTLLRTDDRIA